MTLAAHAKVNLCLAVKYPPRDGYHELDSVFQELDLHDVMEIGIVPRASARNLAQTSMGTALDLICEGVDIPTESNLVFKALDAAERACGVPACKDVDALVVRIEKHIPAGGGLGGGSADAAAMLRGYATIAGLDPLGEPLLGVAQALGADVAFFQYGGAALMEGKGDVLVRRVPSFPLPLVLMGHDGGCSTPAVYRAFDENPQPAGDAYALAAAMEHPSADASELAKFCSNNLQPAALDAADGLGDRLQRAIVDEDVLHALVTGSGSTSYAICADDAAAERFAQRIAPHCAWVHVAHPRYCE